MYTEIPNIPTGTPESRMTALRESKELLSGEGLVSSAGAFGSNKTEHIIPDATELIRLATYIETGHDYADTHPEGKRRPKITNVTVVAPVGGSPEMLEHFLEHVKDGSFLEFLERMKKAEGVDVDDLIADLLSRGPQPEQAEGEESAENDTK